MLRTRELLAEPSLRKRSGTYLPKYLRIPNALRLDGQNPQGAERALYSAYSTRVCYGASPSAFFRNIYHRTHFIICSIITILDTLCPIYNFYFIVVRLSYPVK